MHIGVNQIKSNQIFCMAFPFIVFHPSLSSRAVVVGASGIVVSWTAALSGRGLVIALVEVIARGHGGYLHIRASRASWVVEVACCECIRLYSSDASHCLLVAGCQFVGIVGAAS
jgi:hypothetical protein